MHQNWTIYQRKIIRGFELYELQVDRSGTIMCLEDDDPESEANCSVWIKPPKAVVNTESSVVFDITQTAIREKFPGVTSIERMLQ
ncbi:hypothetical protein A3D03_02945 [Candidatus Gottesmanbacteria bacterium RIFCSPHIGHO2_02_FULL_40_13]|uniref:Uncharacterized protein n=1 Tax=Candidatus Gottesmanbacteria bacterium RIFCSPHIGHO2_02_FULL_40_13 TaxID=1798384 RepID=A0A1F6A9Q9_9BACT|nr:MAG: hypothetical protein A3D03_02945 [Candidatus Gottesmanbacteria bacterium RIFCSPHIGHO2_02_FULL_40_13]